MGTTAGDETAASDKSIIQNFEEDAPDAISLVLSVNGAKFSGSYNIPPTGTGVIIYKQQQTDGRTKYVAEPLNFGLLPQWATPHDSLPVKKNSGTGASYSKEVHAHQSKLFNCRKETLAQKKTVWVQPRAHSRCVVPITGYFEWLTAKKGEKTPYYVHSEQLLLFLAGLYSHNRNYNDTSLVGDGTAYFSSFSIATGPAEGSGSNNMTWLHSRKPIFLAPFSPEWERWLDPQQDWDTSVLECLNCDTNPVYDELKWHVVHGSVGNPKNNSAEVIKEVKATQLSITLFFYPRKRPAEEEPNKRAKKDDIKTENTVKKMDRVTEIKREQASVEGAKNEAKVESERAANTGSDPAKSPRFEPSGTIPKRVKIEHQGSESLLGYGADHKKETNEVSHDELKNADNGS